MDFQISVNSMIYYDIYMKRTGNINDEKNHFRKVHLTALSHQSSFIRKPVYGAGSKEFQATEESVKLVAGVILEVATKAAPLQDYIMYHYNGTYKNLADIDPVDILIINKIDKTQGYYIKEVYMNESKGEWNIDIVGNVNRIEYFARKAYYLVEVRSSLQGEINDLYNNKISNRERI